MSGKAEINQQRENENEIPPEARGNPHRQTEQRAKALVHSSSETTVARARTAQQEARWVDAWQMAYDWRADHWGKMPGDKHRRMMRARERSDIAWEREVVARGSFPNVPISDAVKIHRKCRRTP